MELITTLLYVAMLLLFFCGGTVMLFGIVYTNDKISALGAVIMVASIALINVIFMYLK